MKAYKGFNKDMTCRGFRYEEGKTYHEDNAELCNRGFHACEYPLDCFARTKKDIEVQDLEGNCGISNREKIKHIVCFSGGHSSAIAAVETVRAFGKENVILLNHNLHPRSEDADIKRFKQEVADYLGVPITYANMPGWDEKDQFDCMVAGGGNSFGLIHCTRMLKTEPFAKWLSENFPTEKTHIRDDVKIVYGFDMNEQIRITRRVGVMAAMGYLTEFPLTWDTRTISNIEEVGIKRPITYGIFNHANCIGCLKAGKQHWFTVYCLYPEIWERGKWAEEETGYSILKGKFLSELEPEFSVLKSKNFPPTEKINPQRFWSIARKLIKEDTCLPCECSLRKEAAAYADAANPLRNNG